ncbi:DUF5621 domain-containing protein [Legionella jordanis]|uniref:Dot/Icm T4SS effector n=1 Tax=Legionella jordanis TaxID=456 RepID=A0A0W0V8I1_9GAMM|nr:DUF5621 domain-containing protein [Legionella jordanis]KTD16399.1 Dot/Icm T4SS effector [Legionella jordanis]RMX04398.1 hypothetical protein EAW55_02880 [Legionella jordanis]RMX15589.1 hypothetical protein EAS68_12075 [Legionella jordanis]VEH12140.1 Dot/Icm T4SS effector [Legionella jordanis]
MSNEAAVSFFFLGTSHHRSKRRDVLTTFYEAIKQLGGKAHLFDGVGSSPSSSANLEHPTPGRYIYNPVNDQKSIALDETMKEVRNITQQLTGMAAGEGMDELLFEGIQYLEYLIQQNEGKLPSKINLHGYSRGADACVRLANLLDSLYPDVEVNLFLIDQVPGPGRANDPASYTIPANVKRFESAVMLHENTPGFTPQDRVRYVFAAPEKTLASFRVYPGSHGTATRLTTQEKTNDVPILMHDEMYRFCLETESLPPEAPIPNMVVFTGKDLYEERTAHKLTDAERFHHYNRAQTNLRYYAGAASMSYHAKMILPKRAVLKEHFTYSENHHLFLNQEHAELFQKLYPALYDWFMLNHIDARITSSDVQTQLNHLAEDEPEFHHNLQRICHIDEQLSPRAMRTRSLPPRRKSLIYNELSYLTHSLSTAVNFAYHHMEGAPSTVSICMLHINEALATASSQEEEQAIATLREVTKTAVVFLELCNMENSYLHHQLLKLSYEARHFIQETTNLLELHIQNNHGLGESQKNNIRQVIAAMNHLKESNIDNFDKFKQAKAIIKGLIYELKNPEGEQDLWQNLQDNALHHFDKKYSWTVEKLINHLNELCEPGFYKESLATLMAKQLDSYCKRNFIWNALHQFLSALFRTTLPFFVSPQKTEVATALKNQLLQLNESGQGNDLDAIDKIIKQGHQTLHAIYQSTPRTRPGLMKGELDATLERCKGMISAEINFALKCTEINAEAWSPNISEKRIHLQ